MPRFTRFDIRSWNRRSRLRKPRTECLRQLFTKFRRELLQKWTIRESTCAENTGRLCLLRLVTTRSSMAWARLLLAPVLCILKLLLLRMSRCMLLMATQSETLALQRCWPGHPPTMWAPVTVRLHYDFGSFGAISLRGGCCRR